MGIDRLTKDLHRPLTRRQLRRMTHRGIGLNFLNNFHYVKDANDRVRVAPFASLFTISRNSSSTFRGADGRIEYANENIFVDSQRATGIVNGTGVNRFDNAGIAPDGTNTAVLVTETTASSAHFVGTVATIIEGQTYTASAYVKYSGKSQIIFSFGKSGAPFTRGRFIFDFANGSMTSFPAGSPVTSTNFRAIQLADGWWRLSITVLADYTSTDGFFSITLGNSDGAYIGDGVSGILMWGWQLQRGSIVKPYLVTTVAAKYDQPRIEYNFDGTIAGLLLEGGRTNSVLWSEQLDNVAWTAINVTVAPNAVLAPDNTLTADKIVESAINADHALRQLVNIPAGGVVSASMFVKAGERDRFAIRVLDNAIPTDGAISTLVSSTGSLATGAIGFGTLVFAETRRYADGWWRFDISCRPNGTCTQVIVDFFLINPGTTYLGDGVSGGYMWGMQVEGSAFNAVLGPTMSSYIPTTTSAVVRPVDAPTYVFGSEFNKNIGTIVVEASITAGPAQTTRAVIDVDRGVAGYSSRLQCTGWVFGGSGNSQFAVVDDALAVIVGGIQVASSALTRRMSFGWKQDYFVHATNGVSGGTDTSGTPPQTIISITLGADDAGVSNLFGHIRTVDIYDACESEEANRLLSLQAV